MRVVLLGAPGAGKGTQCKRIVDRYGVAHLSSGDILRKERSEGTDLGQQAQEYMDSGALVPDSLIVEMMNKAIQAAPAAGYILDGFPRTVNQAKELDNALAAGSGKVDAVVLLEVSDGVVAERMTGRRSCPQCGAVYHVTNLKPKVDSVCDQDGAGLVQRPDDTLEVVAKRMETYREQTRPVVDHYRKANTVLEVDADQDVDIVSSQIFEKLDSLAGS